MYIIIPVKYKINHMVFWTESLESSVLWIILFVGICMYNMQVCDYDLFDHRSLMIFKVRKDRDPTKTRSKQQSHHTFTPPFSFFSPILWCCKLPLCFVVPQWTGRHPGAKPWIHRRYGGRWSDGRSWAMWRIYRKQIFEIMCICLLLWVQQDI